MHKPLLRDCGAEIGKAEGYDGLIQEKHSPANYSNRYLLLAFRCSLGVNAQSVNPLRGERRRSRNSTTTSKQGNKQTAKFSMMGPLLSSETQPGNQSFLSHVWWAKILT